MGEHEMNNIGKDAGVDEDCLTQEEREYAEFVTARLARPADYVETKESCTEGVLELQRLFGAFEREHSLQALHEITEAGPGLDIRSHPVRERAREALIPMVEKLNWLETKSNITAEKLTALKADYQKFSMAVGIKTGAFIRHV